MITIARLEKIPFLVHGFGDSESSLAGLRRALSLNSFRTVALRQVHSDSVRFVAQAPRETLRGDALVTRMPDLLLVIRTADCLPVLLVDEDRRAVAAVHCGWRGTLRGLLEKTVEGMNHRYGTDPVRLLAAFGPCIGAGCYEVKDDVRGRFLRAGFPARIFRPLSGRAGRYLFDLAAANRLQLLRAGVRRQNVFSAGVCTHCGVSYPSYRRDGPAAGRMLSFVGLLPPESKA